MLDHGLRWIWITYGNRPYYEQIFSPLTPGPSTGHTVSMSLHNYSHEALDLAMVARKTIVAKDLSILVPYLERAETRVHMASGLRAEEREARTGTSSRSLEEETQALLVAVLRADPLAWVPEHSTVAPGGGGECAPRGPALVPARVGVVDVNHSPQGAAKSAFQDAAMKRAGAGAGWPDLDVRLVTLSGPKGILLELKVGKGRESKEQRERRDRLVSAGFDVRVVRGLGEALLAVVRLLIGEISVEVPF